jgi:hypothetical protein
MIGTILNFDEHSQSGWITGDDQQRYGFELTEWKSELKPKAGLKVDFVINDSKALQIFSLKTTDFQNNLNNQIGQLQESKAMQQFKALFTSGPHNMLGVLSAIFLLISLFTPFEKFTPLLDYEQSFNLFDFGLGKFVMALICLDILMLYGGASSKPIKIVSVLTLGILLMVCFSLYELKNDRNALALLGLGGLSRQNSLSLSWGSFVVVIAAIGFAFATLVSKTQNNPKTF